MINQTPRCPIHDVEMVCPICQSDLEEFAAEDTRQVEQEPTSDLIRDSLPDAPVLSEIERARLDTNPDFIYTLHATGIKLSSGSNYWQVETDMPYPDLIRFCLDIARR